MRTDIIATKTKQVQQELAEWAKEKGVLDSGEQLVFTLRVESIPTVICSSEDVQSLLKMKAEDFFSRERLEVRGDARDMANRARNAVLREIGILKRESHKNIYLVSDFLQDCQFKSAIERCRKLGKKGENLLIATIKKAGLPFHK